MTLIFYPANIKTLLEENQRQYEIMFILSPELKEEHFVSFEEEIKTTIEKLGGTLKKKGVPERRNLAYPIKKFQSGYYLVINFLISPEKLKELPPTLKHKKEILRYITVLVPEKKLRPVSRKKVEPKTEKVEKPQKKITKEGKIQLEEIDKKLEEILGT